MKKGRYSARFYSGVRRGKKEGSGSFFSPCFVRFVHREKLAPASFLLLGSCCSPPFCFLSAGRGFPELPFPSRGFCAFLAGAAASRPDDRPTALLPSPDSVTRPRGRILVRLYLPVPSLTRQDVRKQ